MMVETTANAPSTQPPLRRCVGCAADLTADQFRCPFCGTDQRPVAASAPVNVERSRGAKLRELVAVLAMFGLMVFVVRRSFVVDDPSVSIPAPAESPTTVPTVAVVAGTVELLGAPPEVSSADSASFTYAGTGTPGGVFECRLDGDRFGPCDPNRALFVDLPDGIHTFQIRLVRDDGDATDAESYSWTVDSTSPSLAMSPEGGEFVSSKLVVLESSEPTDIHYTTNGADPTVDDSIYRSPIEVDGPVTVKAVAIDDAGNVSPIVAGDFAYTLAFRDGFETGTLDQWSNVDGLAIDETAARTGATAARATSVDGGRAYAGLELGATATELYVQVAFRVESRGPNPLNLVRLRTDANASLVALSITTGGRLAIQLAGSTSVTSSTVVAPNTWHEAQVHVVVAGAESRVEVWFDGQVIERLNVTTDLGLDPVRTVQLGESSEGRVFDVLFDDVATNDAFIPSSFLILISGPATPAAVTPRATPVATPVAGVPDASPVATPEP